MRDKEYRSLDNVKQESYLIIFGFFMIYYRHLLLLVLLFVVQYTQAQTVQFTSSNLPIFIINTNGIPIPNEPKISADMKVIYHGEGIRNALTDTVYHYRGKIGIETRGSSSQQFPKKQYAVETRDSTGEDMDVPLLGFPEEADWTLYAPYTDKSMYRDVLVYHLAASMGRYASRFKFCEVVVNNEYLGVYVLFEKVKRDKNRVNISKCEAPDTTGDALTGGYIVKIDKLDGADTQGWYSNFLPYPNATNKVFYQYHYPKYEDIKTPQKNYIKNRINQFETVMNSSSYADPLTGYPAQIDVASFVDFYLLNELSKNVDGYRLSTYLHKDRDSKGGKLKAGPVWDYNLGFGNADYFDGWKTNGFQVDYHYNVMPGNDWFYMPAWWYKLFHESKMDLAIKNRWAALRKTVINDVHLFQFIDSLTLVLNEARGRNFQKWPILGIYVWPNYFIGSTYSEELTYLKAWIHNRILWIDGALGYNALEEEISSQKKFELLQNYPNPFNPSTILRYQVSHKTHVLLEVFDNLGRRVTTLVNEVQDPGNYQVGFNASQFNVSSGIYFYRLQADGEQESKQMIFLK